MSNLVCRARFRKRSCQDDIDLSTGGITASELASQVRAINKQSESEYGLRRSADDLKKLWGKHIARRIWLAGPAWSPPTSVTLRSRCARRFCRAT